MGGHRCYNFDSKKLRDAWKKLTGRGSASAEKLRALSAFGVEVDHDDDAPIPSPSA